MIFRYPPFPEVIAFGEDHRKSGIACHHPKLLVLQRKDTIRVVITSANLGPKQVILLSLYFLCFDLESWWRRTDFMPINHCSNYVTHSFDGSVEIRLLDLAWKYFGHRDCLEFHVLSSVKGLATCT